MNLLPMHKYMLSHQWSSDKVLVYYIFMITILGAALGTSAGFIFHNIIVGLSIGAFAGLFVGIVYGIIKSDAE
ncbi:hypothetical protein ACFL6P_06865 [Candidatus Latescibacterota bacterium]